MLLWRFPYRRRQPNRTALSICQFLPRKPTIKVKLRNTCERWTQTVNFVGCVRMYTHTHINLTSVSTQWYCAIVNCSACQVITWQWWKMSQNIEEMRADTEATTVESLLIPRLRFSVDNITSVYARLIYSCGIGCYPLQNEKIYQNSIFIQMRQRDFDFNTLIYVCSATTFIVKYWYDVEHRRRARQKEVARTRERDRDRDRKNAIS